ncbi:MAG: Stage sporulation protein [Solirubrobacterales bacterium]|nr:Stage sporulation protein [Solirubrobacterales bacterium]
MSSPEPSSPPPAFSHPDRLEAVRRTGLLDSGPTDAFDRLAGLAARLLHAPSAFISVVDEHRSYRKASIDRESAGAPPEHGVHESLCRHLLDATGPIVIGDTSQDDRVRHDLPVTDGVRAWVGFPLLGPGGHVLGAFSVVDTTPREWTEREVDILGTLTDAAAAEVALMDALAEERTAREDAARSLTRERRALRRAEALNAAGVALSERNDAASVLRAVVGAIVPDIGVWCAVHLRRRGTDPELVAAGHRDPGREPDVWTLDGPGATSLRTRVATPVMLYNRPQRFVVSDASDPVSALGAREVVSLPLRVRGHTIGALTVGVDPDDEPDAIATIAGLVGQAAVALDNAGLYDELAEVAHVLQQALLPGTLPETPGVQVAVRFRPAAANVQVGGDFYDVFASPRRTDRAFVVGDVAGKGPAAATLTGVVRHTLRAAFFRGDDPQQAVALANEALFDVAEPEKFCTAVYGQLQHAGDHVAVSLVRAGHPPALVLRGTGEVDVLEPRGGVIGYRLDTTWDVATVRLDAGDALLLYTDGAIEFPRRHDVDGEQALRALAAELCAAGASASEIVEAVEHQTIVLSDGPLRDDLALLVLRCAPDPA